MKDAKDLITKMVSEFSMPEELMDRFSACFTMMFMGLDLKVLLEIRCNLTDAIAKNFAIVSQPEILEILKKEMKSLEEVADPKDYFKQRLEEVTICRAHLDRIMSEIHGVGVLHSEIVSAPPRIVSPDEFTAYFKERNAEPVVSLEEYRKMYEDGFGIVYEDETMN